MGPCMVVVIHQRSPTNLLRHRGAPVIQMCTVVHLKSAFLHPVHTQAETEIKAVTARFAPEMLAAVE